MKTTYTFSLYSFYLTNFYNYKKLLKVIIYFSAKSNDEEFPIKKISSRLKIKLEELEEVLKKINFISVCEILNNSTKHTRIPIIHFYNIEFMNFKSLL